LFVCFFFCFLLFLFPFLLCLFFVSNFTIVQICSNLKNTKNLESIQILKIFKFKIICIKDDSYLKIFKFKIFSCSKNIQVWKKQKI
jgi:hypothetical protein